MKVHYSTRVRTKVRTSVRLFKYKVAIGLSPLMAACAVRFFSQWAASLAGWMTAKRLPHSVSVTQAVLP
jgi:hypothetical protein